MAIYSTHCAARPSTLCVRKKEVTNVKEIIFKGEKSDFSLLQRAQLRRTRTDFGT